MKKIHGVMMSSLYVMLKHRKTRHMLFSVEDLFHFYYLSSCSNGHTNYNKDCRGESFHMKALIDVGVSNYCFNHANTNPLLDSICSLFSIKDHLLQVFFVPQIFFATDMVTLLFMSYNRTIDTYKGTVQIA